MPLVQVQLVQLSTPGDRTIPRYKVGNAWKLYQRAYLDRPTYVQG